LFIERAKSNVLFKRFYDCNDANTHFGVVREYRYKLPNKEGSPNKIGRKFDKFWLTKLLKGLV